MIILDLGLPDMSGFEVVRRLRSAKVGTPVVILSGSAVLADKIRALNAGADDYMTKPFSSEELTARLRTLVRRSNGYCNARICVGPMILDLAAKTLEANGFRIDLSAKEYQILELLSLRRGVTVNKETPDRPHLWRWRMSGQPHDASIRAPFAPEAGRRRTRRTNYRNRARSGLPDATCGLTGPRLVGFGQDSVQPLFQVFP